jgi:hypothetical protein
MTRKDFELIAANFAQQIAKYPKGSAEHMALADTIGTMTARLQANYPSFQPARFVAACHGLTK